jgi:hypothetical protein
MTTHDAPCRRCREPAHGLDQLLGGGTGCDRIRYLVADVYPYAGVSA